jgi:hypothetical protein
LVEEVFHLRQLHPKTIENLKFIKSWLEEKLLELK